MKIHVRLLPMEQSDLGLHFFPFQLLCLDVLLECINKLFPFRMIMVINLPVPTFFLIFRVVWSVLYGLTEGTCFESDEPPCQRFLR